MNIKLLRNRTRLLMFGLVSVVTAYSFSSFKNCTTAEGMPQNNSPVVAQPAGTPVANTSQEIGDHAQQITDLFEGLINDGMQSAGFDSLGSAAPVVDVPVVEKPQTPTVDDKAQNVAAAPATKAEGDNVTVTVKPGEDGKATVKAELDKRGASENESVSDSSAASEATVSELKGYKKSELRQFLAVVRDFAGVKDGDSKDVFDRNTRKGFIKKISSAKDGEVESLKSVIKNAVSKMSNINVLGDVVRPLQEFLENLLELKDLSEDKKSAIEKELRNFESSLSSVKANFIRRSSVLDLVKKLMEDCAKSSFSENLRNSKFELSNSLYSNVNDLIDIVTKLNNQSRLNPAIIDFLFLSKYIGSSYGKTGEMLDIYRRYIFDFGSYNGEGCLVLGLLRNILSAKENGGVFSSNRNKLDSDNFSLRGYRHLNNNRDVIQIESQEDAERIVSGLFNLLTNLTKPLSGRALKSMNIPEEVAGAFNALVSELGKTSSSSYRVIDFIRDYSLLESVLIRVLSQAFEKNSLGTTDAIQLNSIYQGSFESIDSIKKMYFDRKDQSSSVALETPGNSGGYGIGKFSQYDIYKFLTGTSADSISADVSSEASGVEKDGVHVSSALLPAFGGKMLLTGKAAARAIMAYAGLTPASDFVWPMKEILNEAPTNNGKDPFWTRLRQEFGVNKKLANDDGIKSYNEAFSCLAGDVNSLYVGSYNNILNSEPVEAFKNMSEEPFNTAANVGEHSTYSFDLRTNPWSMVYFSSKNPKAAEEQGFIVGGNWAAFGVNDEARQNLKLGCNGLLNNSKINNLYPPTVTPKVVPVDFASSSGWGPYDAHNAPFPMWFDAWGNVDYDQSGQPLANTVFMRPFKQNSQKSVDFIFSPFIFQRIKNHMKYLVCGSANRMYLGNLLSNNDLFQVENLIDVFGTSSLDRVVKQKPGRERSNQEVVAKWFSLIKDKKFLDVLNRFRGNIAGPNGTQGDFAGIRNFGYEFLPGNEEIDSNLRRQHVGRDVEIGSGYSRRDKFNLDSYFKFDSDRRVLRKELDNSYFSIHSQKFASDSPHFFATLVDLYSGEGIIGSYQSGGLAKAFKNAGFDVEFSDMALVYKLLSGVLSDGTDKDGIQSADDYSGLKDLLF